MPRTKEEINAYNRARYAADPTSQKRASRNWILRNRERFNKRARDWQRKTRKKRYNPNTIEGRRRLDRENAQKRRARSILKHEVLMHYGNGLLKCRWNGCEITDLDMLTLDHVENNGAQHRKQYGSLGRAAHLYRHLRRDGFPSGYQTLCFNHQVKKEMIRKRMERGEHVI